jgi:putative ABC transport system substrate-binding protein
MRRREFITLIGSTAAMWPLGAPAQQPEKPRRIGVLLNRAAGDPEAADSVGAFVQGMGELGWRIGGNLRIEYRYSAGNPELFRKYASELVALAPDAILAASTLSVAALQQFSRSIPIVFTSVSDPVGAGIVDSLARPGGNATGFMLAEFSVSGKWLELLKQVAPELKRVAVLRHSANPAGIAQFGAIQAVAASLGVAVTPIDVQDASAIERAVAAFARSENCGIIVTGSAIATIHRELIITLAARHKLPAFYRPLCCRQWWLDLLWARFRRPVPARSRLCRPHPEGREGCRPAGASADQVRTGYQSQDGQGAWPERSPDLAGERQRGD